MIATVPASSVRRMEPGPSASLSHHWSPSVAARLILRVIRFPLSAAPARFGSGPTAAGR